MRRDHTEGMNSRVHPTYKTKYRVANWASYDRALVGRGDITLWVSPEAIATWEPVGVGTRGGQQKYSDVAIETTLTLRLLFHLPLRQAGMCPESCRKAFWRNAPADWLTTLPRYAA